MGAVSAALGAGFVGAGSAMGASRAQPDRLGAGRDDRHPGADHGVGHRHRHRGRRCVTITADATQTIAATVVAGSVAISAGGGDRPGRCGRQHAQPRRVPGARHIDGDGATGIKAASVSVEASDHPTSLFTGSVPAAALGGVSGTVAIAVGLAKNEIANEVYA